MPLPVERSQGSVSSLVARFQTAADRDAEQARRQSHPPRRISSNTFPHSSGPSPSTSQITTPNQVKKPLPDVSPEPVIQSTSSHDETIDHKTEPEDGGKKDGFKDKIEVVKEKGKDLAHNLKDLSISVSNEDQSNTQAAQKAPNTTKERADGEQSQTKVVESPLKTRATAGSPVQNKIVPKPTSRPSNTASPASKEISTSSSTPSRASKLSTPRFSTTSSHRKEESSDSKKSVNSAKKIPPSTSRTVVSRAPSSTPRLVPSLTGPAKRTPPTVDSTQPMPLRPQLTGTPSKPTVSYLAKTRTPGSSDKSQQPSTGKSNSSIIRSRLSMSPSPGPTSTPTRTLTSSGSRLLQGTAASRAKASEVKSPPSSVGRKTSSSRPSAVEALSPSKPKVAANDKGPSPAARPLRMPGNARIGLAGAGAGTGGKSGTELSDSLTAKLKSGEISGEEIVRQADERAQNGNDHQESPTSRQTKADETLRENVGDATPSGSKDENETTEVIGDHESTTGDVPAKTSDPAESIKGDGSTQQAGTSESQADGAPIAQEASKGPAKVEDVDHEEIADIPDL